MMGQIETDKYRTESSRVTSGRGTNYKENKTTHDGDGDEVKVQEEENIHNE